MIERGDKVLCINTDWTTKVQDVYNFPNTKDVYTVESLFMRNNYVYISLREMDPDDFYWIGYFRKVENDDKFAENILNNILEQVKQKELIEI